MKNRNDVVYEAPRAESMDLKIENSVMSEGGDAGGGDIPPGGPDEPA